MLDESSLVDLVVGLTTEAPGQVGWLEEAAETQAHEDGLECEGKEA